MTQDIDMQALRDEFTAWVATKPADEAYDYMSLSECAWAQFLEARGTPKTDNQDPLWQMQWSTKIFPVMESEKFYDSISAKPWTFGDLHRRLICSCNIQLDALAWSLMHS